MDIKAYEHMQDNIKNAVLQKAYAANPEFTNELRTHSWELDISDMVWECTACYALLHSGQRRFAQCKGRQR